MRSDTITRTELCRMFDHTCLKPFADDSMFHILCAEAKEGDFAMVAINSEPVALCKKLLRDTDVHVGAAISFPLGQTTLESKLFETQNAIDNGADEIDYVINLGALKNGNYDYLRKEMQSLVALCHRYNVLCKVIFENCYLTKYEIATLSQIAREEQPDYIKTSTGFGTSGATPEDVALMCKMVGDSVKVKAAGGVRSWATCKQMIDAGATRIGTSSSLIILEEFDKERATQFEKEVVT